MEVRAEAGPHGWRRCGIRWGRCGVGLQPDRRCPRDPVVRRSEHLLGAALDDIQVRGATEHAIVVDVEPSVQPEARVEDERAHECGGAVAGAFERRCERRRVAESESAVVAHGVVQWIARRHQARVRRQRERNVRVRPIEPQPGPRESIDGGREPAVAAVRADAICAKRVDRDEQDVGAAKHPRRQRLRLSGHMAAREPHPDRDRENRSADNRPCGESLHRLPLQLRDGRSDSRHVAGIAIARRLAREALEVR